MSVVIVTDNCYLVCESINFINLQEYSNQGLAGWDINRRGSKVLPDKEKIYEIVVDFLPAVAPSHASPRRDITETFKFKIRGKKEAQLTFKEIVKQIRDQMPDNLHLDKLIQNILK